MKNYSEKETIEKTISNQVDKLPYHAPQLVEWGTLIDLTAGSNNSPGDGFGNGTAFTFAP